MKTYRILTKTDDEFNFVKSHLEQVTEREETSNIYADIAEEKFTGSDRGSGHFIITCNNDLMTRIERKFSNIKGIKIQKDL